MTFEAYINNIHAKTGKTPEDFFEEAVGQGVLHPDTKTMEFVNWLKAHSGLGHGHAMAVWESFRRNGWIPMSTGNVPSSGGRLAGAKRTSRENAK